MSAAARLFAGLTLITVPAIVYGGLTVLGVVSGDRLGKGVGRPLTPEQTAFFRAGHAHAGVLVILSLVLQLMLDHARLPVELTWAFRIAAPLAATFVSGGFFGVAFMPGFRVVLYTGAALVAVVTLGTGVGLLR
ncbi:MAG TPA: hypothetical protein VMT11_12330 [Myxococcaceae bacterium]|nr:hypothetical protein [Myxococcaceae bacterium]